LKRGANARAAADKLTEHFGYPFRARDWGQLNKNLFRAIAHQKTVIAICLVMIVFVAAFNVVSTLMMMIYDKSKEISILKAMGFRPSQGFALFCSVGVGIGLVGTVLGALAGVLLNLLLARTRFIDLPADIYSIGFLPASNHSFFHLSSSTYIVSSPAEVSV
jgi:lipoprotein-releasing system permease protein